VNPASSVHSTRLKKSGQILCCTEQQNCRWLSLSLAVTLVQAANDTGVFDFRAGHAMLQFAVCRGEVQCYTSWWTDCHSQQPARCPHLPHLVNSDQHELQALMYQSVFKI
jgi:hypothetical protein